MALEHIHQVKNFVERKRLRQLMHRTNSHATVFLLRHIVMMVTTGYIVWLAHSTVLFVPAMALHGIGIVHLFSPQHEFAHRTAFSTRWINDVFGWLFGFLILLPNIYFRWEHTNHHSYTQDTRLDPQFISQPKNLWHYFLYLSSLPYWWGFITAASRHVVGNITTEEKRFIPKTEVTKVIWEARIIVVSYLLIVLAVILFEAHSLLWYWLVPRFLAEPYMRWVRMTEHVGRPVDNTDLMVNTRTVLTNPLVCWLAWNMPFHTEHHLSPSVPFHALPRLHEEIKEHHGIISRGFFRAHADILRGIAKSILGEES